MFKCYFRVVIKDGLWPSGEYRFISKYNVMLREETQDEIDNNEKS